MEALEDDVREGGQEVGVGAELDVFLDLRYNPARIILLQHIEQLMELRKRIHRRRGLLHRLLHLLLAARLIRDEGLLPDLREGLRLRMSRHFHEFELFEYLDLWIRNLSAKSDIFVI